MTKLHTDFASAKADFLANLQRRNVRTWDQLNQELSLYCACYSLPVVVAIEFAADAYPQFSEQLTKKRQLVREFYGY